MAVNRAFRALAAACTLLLATGCSWFDGDEADEEFRYAALGASDAVGIGAWPLDEGYVYQLRRRLEQRYPDREVRLRNLGVAGAKATEILQSQVSGAVAHDPHLTTLWTGANDVIGGVTEGAFRDTLHAILLAVQARSRLTAVADLPDLTVLPRFTNQPDRDVTTARVAAFNDAIHAEVAEHGARLVDLYSTDLAGNPEYVSVDGFHPSNAGYARITELFWAVIEPAQPRLDGMAAAGARGPVRLAFPALPGW